MKIRFPKYVGAEKPEITEAEKLHADGLGLSRFWELEEKRVRVRVEETGLEVWLEQKGTELRISVHGQRGRTALLPSAGNVFYIGEVPR